MVMAIWGAILISFIVNLVSCAFTLTCQQEHALEDITKSKLAAKAISNSIKYFNLKKQLHRLVIKSLNGRRINA